MIVIENPKIRINLVDEINIDNKDKDDKQI